MSARTTAALSTPPPWISRTTQRRVLRVVVYGLLIFFALLFLIPVYMVLVTSFKSFDQVSLSSMWNFPTQFTLDGFREAFDKLSPNLLNSFILVIPATLISAVVGSLNGYVLSKWRFRGANVLFPLMLFGMFIPYQAILIPLVQFLGKTGLYGHISGLIAVNVIYGMPITTLIFRNYYAEVPNEMLEAGSIDGAGFFGLYRHLILPVSAPRFVVVVIWQFTQIWNEFSSRSAS